MWIKLVNVASNRPAVFRAESVAYFSAGAAEDGRPTVDVVFAWGISASFYTTLASFYAALEGLTDLIGAEIAK